jgi:hypothetical protein
MRLRAVVPLALIAFAVVGCATDPAEQSAGTPRASASSSAAERDVGAVRSTTTARPAPTAGSLDPKLAAEAQAFVRDFMAASDRATASGDFAEVKRLVAAGCEPCQASIAYFTKLYAGGGSVTGGAFMRPKLSAQPAGASGAVRVTVEATIAAYTVKQRGRSTDYPAERVSYTYTVRKTEAGWQVVGRSF